jgi:hypothetical protein
LVISGKSAVANGVTTDRRLEPGRPVKVAVSERYHPATGSTPGQR